MYHVVSQSYKTLIDLKLTNHKSTLFLSWNIAVVKHNIYIRFTSLYVSVDKLVISYYTPPSILSGYMGSFNNAFANCKCFISCIKFALIQ